MTQQNAALVEESAAAAASLQQSAEQLTQVVSAFQVDGVNGSPLRAASRSAFTPSPSRPSRPLSKAAAPAKIAGAPNTRLGMTGDGKKRQTLAAGATSGDDGAWQQI
jgi:hypothetical protein